MALTAIAAAGAIASAGAGIYGAMQSGRNQKATNALNEKNYQLNKSQNIQNGLQDAIAAAYNSQQRGVDNKRYDEAVGREDKQRAFINAMATATQRDADGNSVQFDPVTNSWQTVSNGIGRTNVQRRQQQDSTGYTQALLGSTLGNVRNQDRLRDQGLQQTQARSLAQELLTRYGQNQGRTPQQMESAGIERNVAAVTDPIKTGGNMAMLAGYRQGNSGNDALMGALARQSQGGTRSAIANARYDAPGASAGDRDAQAKSLLAPSTTLAERGNAAAGGSAPVFNGDTTGALINSIQRSNPAGAGSQLNPRSGGMMPVGRASTDLRAYTPLSASGNQWPGVAESLNSLLSNKNIGRTADNLGRWWNGGESYNVTQPTQGTNRGLVDALMKQQPDFNNV